MVSQPTKVSMASPRLKIRSKACSMEPGRVLDVLHGVGAFQQFAVERPVQVHAGDPGKVVGDDAEYPRPHRQWRSTR